MADETTKGILLAKTEDWSYDQYSLDEFYVVSSLYYSPETDKYYTNNAMYDFDINDEGGYIPAETPESSYVVNLTKSQALEILDRKHDETAGSKDIAGIVNRLRNEVENSTKILLARTSGQYRDPEDGDYIDAETSLYYSKGTDEYYTEHCESYLYGGTPLSREVTALTKDKALSLFDECAKDNSGYNGIEMAPDEWVPASTVVNNKEVAGIIDNLRNEVNGVHNDTGSSATTIYGSITFKPYKEPFRVFVGCRDGGEIVVGPFETDMGPIEYSNMHHGRGGVARGYI